MEKTDAEKFLSRIEILQDSKKKDKILIKEKRLEGQVKKYFHKIYISMPISDVGNYEPHHYLSFIRHGVFLRENVAWCKTIPEDIFYNYILHYRVNDESIVPCRQFFYDKLIERIDGLTLKEAIISINYWCAEHATYKSTNERTASPMSVLNSGFGRCGEESTFVVTAFRSVGIPARQVYAPKWSHCDDNHAWVEVWCNGEWFFLGACEPETKLNTGWFTKAATRALLIQTKIFSKTKEEKSFLTYDGIQLVNDTSNYAKCKRVIIKVVDKDKKPIKDVRVRFEIVNYSELASIVTLKTNAEGRVSIELGLGDVHLHLHKDHRYITKKIDLKETQILEINWDEAIEEEQGIKDFEMKAPREGEYIGPQYIEEEKLAIKQKLKEANKKREARLKKIEVQSEILLKSLSVDKVYKERISRILLEAGHNAKEIVGFIKSTSGSLEDKIQLLEVLEEKDYSDVECNFLKEQLSNTVGYKTDFPENIFAEYLLNPRIYHENLTSYCEFIKEYFLQDQKAIFKENPNKIWTYIQENIWGSKEHPFHPLYICPQGALEIKQATLLSKKILFVAICRTIGVPSKIDYKDFGLYFYNKGDFVRVLEGHKTSIGYGGLTIQSKDNTQWVYNTNWTLGVLQSGVYNTLNLEELSCCEKQFTLKLEAGSYRLLTTNRMPNGNVLCKAYHFRISERENKVIEIELKAGRLDEMAKNVKIEDFKVLNESNNKYLMSELIEIHKNALVMWLEANEEPTEHILNEMLENKMAYNEGKWPIVFILKEKAHISNKLIQKVLECIPRIQVYYSDTLNVEESIARSIYVEPDKLPLVVVVSNKLYARYGFSGYNVGMGNLLLNLLEVSS